MARLRTVTCASVRGPRPALALTADIGRGPGNLDHIAQMPTDERACTTDSTAHRLMEKKKKKGGPRPALALTADLGRGTGNLDHSAEMPTDERSCTTDSTAHRLMEKKKKKKKGDRVQFWR